MDRFPGKPPRLDTIFSTSEHPLFFITFNTMYRRSVLANDTVQSTFIAYCKRGCEMGAVEVGRYVLMPDHAHLFVRGNDDFDLGIWIRGLKRAMSKALCVGVCETKSRAQRFGNTHGGLAISRRDRAYRPPVIL